MTITRITIMSGITYYKVALYSFCFLFLTFLSPVCNALNEARVSVSKLIDLKGSAKGSYTNIFGITNNWLAIVNTSNTVTLWDLTNNKQNCSIEVQGGVKGIQFSHNEERLIITHRNRILSMWETKNCQPDNRLLSRDRQIRWITFNPKYDRSVIMLKNYEFQLIDGLSGKTIRSLSGHGEYIGGTDAPFNLGDNYILTINKKGLLKSWNAINGKEIDSLIKHPPVKNINRYEFSPYGKWLITLLKSDKNKFFVIDTTGQNKYIEFIGDTLLRTGDYGVRLPVFSPDNRTLIVAEISGNITLLDLYKGAATRVLKGHNSQVNQAFFINNGSHLVSSSVEDKKIFIWDLQNSKDPWVIRPTFEEDIEGEELFIFSPDGKKVIVRDGSGKLTLWDTIRGRIIKELQKNGDLQWIEFSPNGEVVVTGSEFSPAQLWSTETGKKLAIFGDKVESGFVTNVSFGPKSKRLVINLQNGGLQTVYIHKN